MDHSNQMMLKSFKGTMLDHSQSNDSVMKFLTNRLTKIRNESVDEFRYQIVRLETIHNIIPSNDK